MDGDGWQLHPPPVASPVSSVDTSSPFAFQPFPYTLSSKQQQQQQLQQQQQQQSQTASVEQSSKAVPALPAPHLAVAAVPLYAVSQHPTISSDPAHFPLCRSPFIRTTLSLLILLLHWPLQLSLLPPRCPPLRLSRPSRPSCPLIPRLSVVLLLALLLALVLPSLAACPLCFSLCT